MCFWLKENSRVYSQEMSISIPETSPGPWGYDNGYQLRSLPSERFRVTEVLSPVEHYVIKTAEEQSAQANLGNSAAWARWISEQQPVTFSTPATTAQLVRNERGQLTTELACVQWVDGRHPTEQELPDIIPGYADAIHEMSQLAVAWEASAGEWVHQKFVKLGSPVVKRIADKMLAAEIEEIMDPDAIGETPGGVVHGDLVPKNTIVDADQTLWPFDAEFGTHGLRPDFVVPRMRDAGYLYHILRCQYQQPATAKQLYNELETRFYEEPDWERQFWLATLERTLSMYNFFVLNKPSSPDFDTRRLNPDPYVGILYEAVSQLRA